MAVMLNRWLKITDHMKLEAARIVRTDRGFLKLLAFCAAALMAASAASGASLTESCIIPSASVEFTYDCNEPLFDLGPDFVLTGVTLTIESSATINMAVLNVDNESHNFTLSASVPMTVFGPGPYSVSTTASAGPESGDLASEQIATYSDQAASGPDEVDVLPEDLFLFVGSGSQTFDFDVQGGPIDLNATSDATAPLVIWFSDSATESGDFTVEYDYTAISPVPEPHAAALFIAGSALLGLVFTRRRTLRKS